MLDEKLARVDFVMRALEELRLKSYDDWPVTFMDPKQMAEAGLYYTCNDDMARCPFCKVVMGGWEPGDDPLDRHKRLRPSCSFVVKHADEGVCDYTTL
jgi:hypothetical protein